MVYLHRIYTKTGDDGKTSIGNGARLAKTEPRIIAIGAVDELNSLLGVVHASGFTEPYATRLRMIQNDLFDLGADLCVPETEPAPDDPVPEHPPLRVTPGQVQRLERWIDVETDRLVPLTSFILPGGAPSAAHLHFARAVCRRAEIEVLTLANREPVNHQVPVYLNRLSDLLFVWSRVANELGAGDVLWVPGKSRGET